MITLATAAIVFGGIIFAIVMLLIARWDANNVIARLYKEDEMDFLRKVKAEIVKPKKENLDVPQ